MKKEKPIKYFFKNCTLKFSTSIRNSDGSFSFTHHKIEDCYIITTEGKKTIEYIQQYGCKLKYNKTRSKSAKFIGKNVTEKEFRMLLNELKFETIENIQALNDAEIKKERCIEFYDFPIILK